MATTYFKLASDVGQLLVYPLDLCLFALAVPDVRYEDGEPPHAIASYSGHPRLLLMLKLESLTC